MKRDIRWLPFTVGLLLLFVWLSGLAVAQVASENDIALCHGSVELARAGNIVEAERLAARISNEYRKAVAYGQIAIGQAMAGHFAEAEATIAKHCRNHNNSNIYRWIAEAQIQANDLSGAKTSVTHVNPENGREIILHQIADAQAKAGDMTGAKATRALIKKEFGDPGMEKFIEILLLLVVAILGTRQFFCMWPIGGDVVRNFSPRWHYFSRCRQGMCLSCPSHSLLSCWMTYSGGVVLV